GQAMRTPTANNSTPERATSAAPPTKPDSAAPAMTAGRPASTATLTSRRSSSPTRRYSRAPTTHAGSIAGSGDAIAIGAGTPISTSTGVANAEPPAPNTPNV